MNATISPATAWAALPVLLAGAFMVVLDFFIVNVALPSIATDLGAGDSALEWVVAGYGLTFAAFLITAGRLGDDLGRRRVYAIGLALFTVASAACGLAPSPTTLVLARIAQGVAGAVVMPQVLAIIGVTYRGTGLRARDEHLRRGARPGGRRRPGDRRRARGDRLRRARLAQLLPDQRARRPRRAGAHAAAGARVARRAPQPAGRDRRRGRCDRPDRDPAAPDRGPRARLARLDLGLAGPRPRRPGRRSCGASGGWASRAATRCWTSGCSASAASRRDWRPSCSSPPRRRRSSCSSRSTCSSAAGWARWRPGLVFTILAVAYVATSGPAPALTARYGRLVVAAGGLALTLGLALLAVAVAGGRHRGIAARARPRPRCWRAPGIGLCFTPLTSTVLANVDPARAGSASGAMSAMQQVGYALGVAITGVIFFGAADDGIAHAFELSLIQLAARFRRNRCDVAPVPPPALGPDWCGRKSGMRQMSHKANKSPIRWLRAWSTPASTSHRTSTATPSCTPAST